MSALPTVPPVPGRTAWHERDYRDALGTFCTGVTVVVTGGRDPVGVTVNSFASVSLAPPLVLFCAGKGSRVERRLVRGSPFSVNVLPGDQEDVARHFASPSRGSGTRSLESVEWQWGRRVDVPVITSATAGLECRVRDVHSAGDHVIYVGEVHWLHPVRPTGTSLVFVRGRFARVGDVNADPGPPPEVGLRPRPTAPGPGGSRPGAR
ncbi:flavin reductase family protein [Phycicoccus flavus]|uniref:flavin reductase family protein n=1 Tax=Phycicoccus flavus TaxID=2502783 RepID=UPI000FEB782F|nr:flavin reductase family protein [Phycicoccus flavus]NHA69049.1 flavin reductase family protein [Phycicoccus flavus]